LIRGACRNALARVLLAQSLAAFCVAQFPQAKSIDRNLAAAWAEMRSTEGQNYRNRLVGELRQLCLIYALDGYRRLCSSRNRPCAETCAVYPIEGRSHRLFALLDSWQYRNSRGKRTAEEYSMLFRLYYCCGLRLSEARLLKKKSVDFTNNILTILQSKGSKDRLVYLPLDGAKLLQEYLRKTQKLFSNTPWLFPGQDPSQPLTASAIQRRFKECWRSLPFAGFTNKEPTPHCLRHAFVMERMNDRMALGIDLQAMLPYLSSYLGHKSPAETFYYYHLVERAFAVVREKDTVSDRVIPEVQVYEEF
jgi:integrase